MHILYTCIHMYIFTHVYTCVCVSVYIYAYIHMYIYERPLRTHSEQGGEVGGWGRVPFSRNLMKPTPRRKWYLTTGRRFH